MDWFHRTKAFCCALSYVYLMSGQPDQTFFHHYQGSIDFQMKTAFVTLVLASAGLAAELGREARSLDLVSS